MIASLNLKILRQMLRRMSGFETYPIPAFKVELAVEDKLSSFQFVVVVEHKFNLGTGFNLTNPERLRPRGVPCISTDMANPSAPNKNRLRD